MLKWLNNYFEFKWALLDVNEKQKWKANLYQTRNEKCLELLNLHLVGVLVKWQILGLRIARSRVQVRPGSWSGRLSLPFLKGRKMSTSHQGQNLIFTARIIAKSHVKGTQGGTPVPCSDHLVRALLGCQTRVIVPISTILSDFFRF